MTSGAVIGLDPLVVLVIFGAAAVVLGLADAIYALVRLARYLSRRGARSP